MSTSIREIRSLFKKLKPKSTDNIFFTWADACRAMHITSKVMLRYKRKMGVGLPVTRAFIENWIAEHKKVPMLKNDRLLAKVLAYRLGRGMTDYYMWKTFNLTPYQLTKIWNEILRRYDEISKKCNVYVPSTVEGAMVLYRSIRSGRNRRNIMMVNRNRRRKNELS